MLPSSRDALQQELQAARAELDQQVAAGRDAAPLRDRIAALEKALRKMAAEPQAAEPQAGGTLGNRWVLDTPLGGSGFATVWAGRDLSSGSPVAIKVLDPTTANHPGRVAHFFDGADRLRGIQHENIASVLAVERTAGASPGYLVSELVDGGDLRWLASDGPLPPAVVVDILVEVAQALAAAHAAGLVHRDIKPTNILFDTERVLHVTDFDLLRPEDGPAGLPMGCFAYAAPEQTTRPEQVGPASDLYSLAMTGLFLLHGQTLAPGTFADPVGFVDRLNLGPLGDVLKQCVAWEPRQRPQTADAFIAALTAAGIAPQQEGDQLAQAIARLERTELVRARAAQRLADAPPTFVAARNHGSPSARPEVAAPSRIERSADPSPVGERTGHDTIPDAPPERPAPTASVDPGRTSAPRRTSAPGRTSAPTTSAETDVPVPIPKSRRLVPALSRLRRAGKARDSAPNRVLFFSMLASLVTLGGLVAYALWLFR